jgi:hypothetical protein
MQIMQNAVRFFLLFFLISFCDVENASRTSVGSVGSGNDDAPKKDPAKVKELEDKFNGKILENGVRVF